MSCRDVTCADERRNLRDEVSDLEAELAEMEAEAPKWDVVKEANELREFVECVAEVARHDEEAHKFCALCLRCEAERLLGARPSKGLGL